MHCDPNTKNVHLIDKHIEQGKDAFILVYMEGCGPCNATRPEWNKIKSHPAFHNKNKYNNTLIVDVDKNVSPSLKYIGDIDGFPTMKYISNNGNTVEKYEDAALSKKDRSLDSFVEWIEQKTNKVNKPLGPMSSPHHLARRLHHSQMNIRYQPKRLTKTKRHKRSKRNMKTKIKTKIKTKTKRINRYNMRKHNK